MFSIKNIRKNCLEMLKIDALNSFNSDTVTVEINSEISPVKFYSDNDKLIHLICPLRV